jgi:outer membrane protein OmpA-like peptidoglycan-associated protein
MNEKMSRARTTPIALLAIGAIMWAVPALAQGIEQEIEQATARLEAARESNLDSIAPGSFAKAVQKHDDALARFEKGGKIEEIRAQLTGMNEALAKCEELEEIGNVILRDALTARADATKSEAQDLQPELWANAEKSMKAAGGKIESGDQNGARTESAKAQGLYRDAELQAIRKAVLGGVWDLQAQAKTQKAAERAPATLASAEAALTAADTAVKNDRYARETADALAQKAAGEFQHTLNICSQIEKMDQDPKTAREAMIRGYEAEIEKVAGAVGVEANFTEGAGAVTSEILDATKRQEAERAKLAAEVSSLEQKIAHLEGDMTGARTQLATLSDRDAELKKREQLELKMQEVQAAFKGDEAEVLLKGEQMIIRLYGLSFPVGSAEIRPENFGLLSKVQHVLGEFPKAALSIEGHTDSQGAVEKNRTLSQARADAVREYLLANMKLNPERVAAVGRGEDRPIANNETEEGRAKNRRIDLMLDIPSN